MKNIIFLFIGFLMLQCTCLGNDRMGTKKDLPPEGSITVFCSPDLYNITAMWAEEYGSINPDTKITILNTSDKTNLDELNKGLIAGFASENYLQSEERRSEWNIVVGREIIVPIINSNNPLIKEIASRGVSPQELTRLFEKPGERNWSTLLGVGKDLPVHYYMISDESVNSTVSGFLGTDLMVEDATKTGSAAEVISDIQNDPLAIGFCRLTDLIDTENQTIAGNINFLPIDKNGNGELDYFENIYVDLNTFSRGVWVGKYPQELVTNIYYMSSVKPSHAEEKSFVNWVLTDGQTFLNTSGYSGLLTIERQSKINMLKDDQTIRIVNAENYSGLKTVIMVLLVLILVGITIEGIILSIRYKKSETQANLRGFAGVFNENSVKVPLGLFYDKTHTWAFMEKGGLVKIGIDDFLQHVTGPLTRVKMKNTGNKVKKGEEILSVIQNGKQINIYAPISGTIKEKNKILDTNSSLLNSSPYSEGWVYMIEPTNWLREIQFLTMGKKYKEWLKSEFSRLKDFLSNSLKNDTVEYSHIILQDGGELKDGILTNFGPETWEDFQTNFIDTSS